jgi:hypothetical protein
LLKRLPERKQFVCKQMLDLIQRASIEDPPPSMQTVATRVGRGAAYVRVPHPELCKTIQSRDHAQRTLAAASRRAAYRAEITSAIADLQHRGITPSRRRVLAAIPQPAMRSSHIVDQQIAACRREMEVSPANMAAGGRS